MTDQQPQPFDLADLTPAADTVEVEVFDPRTRRGTGIFITVASKDSDRYKKKLREQINRRFKQMGRRIAVQMTAEENEAEALELLVHVTTGWRNVTYKGVALDLNDANARMLYEQVPVIREQVEDAINDRGNFMRR